MCGQAHICPKSRTPNHPSRTVAQIQSIAIKILGSNGQCQPDRQGKQHRNSRWSPQRRCLHICLSHAEPSSVRRRPSRQPPPSTLSHLTSTAPVRRTTGASTYKKVNKTTFDVPPLSRTASPAALAALAAALSASLPHAWLQLAPHRQRLHICLPRTATRAATNPLAYRGWRAPRPRRSAPILEFY